MLIKSEQCKILPSLLTKNFGPHIKCFDSMKKLIKNTRIES